MLTTDQQFLQFQKDWQDVRAMAADFDKILYGMRCAFESVSERQAELASAYNQHVETVQGYLRGIAQRLIEMDDRVSRLEHDGQW